MSSRFPVVAAASVLALAACGTPPPAKQAPVYSPSRPGTIGTQDPYRQGLGQVRSIERLSARQSTSGGGAVVGAIVGAVIGRQMGGTSMARDAATAAAAVGGAWVGNEIEKNRSGGSDIWRITVDLDRGGQAVLDVPDPAGLRVGERVRVDGARVYRL